ncbi:MAG: hypothetical protein GX579_02855 [Chloroflexi bacterium]|nr:hypothetical protein [Chloroflexota bacterium]
MTSARFSGRTPVRRRSETDLLTGSEPPAELDGHHMPLERGIAVPSGERMARAGEVQVAAVIVQVEGAEVKGKAAGRQMGIPLGPFCFSMFRSAASAIVPTARNRLCWLLRLSRAGVTGVF